MGLKGIFAGIGLGIAAYLFSPSAAAQESPEESRYKIEFGAETARTAPEKLAFGKKLFEKSKEAEGAYEECLEDKALEFLSQSGKLEAYEPIIAIHKDDVSDFPNEKVKYQEKVVSEYEKWSRSIISFKDKAEVQKKQVAEYFTLSGFYEDSNEYAKAVDVLNKARNLAQALKLEKTVLDQIASSYELNREAADRQKQADIAVEKAKTGDKQAMLAAGEYFFCLGDFEKARQYLKGTDYEQAFRLMDIASKDRQKESENGLSEEVVGKYREAVGKRDRKTIESLLPVFELEPSLWYHVERASQGQPGIEEKSQSLITKQRTVAGDVYLQLGDSFASVLAKQKGKQEQISLCQNSLMYYEAAAKKLTEGDDRTRAEKMVATLEKRLSELGGVRKGLGIAEAQKGHFWDFDSDENCQDFTRNWYVNGGEWQRIGPMRYFSENKVGRWEISNGKLNGNKDSLQIWYKKDVPNEISVATKANAPSVAIILFGSGRDVIGNKTPGYTFVYGGTFKTNICYPTWDQLLVSGDFKFPKTQTIIKAMCHNNTFYLSLGEHILVTIVPENFLNNHRLGFYIGRSANIDLDDILVKY